MKSKKLRYFLIAGVTISVVLSGFGLVQRASSRPIGVTFSPHPAFAMVGSASVADVAERVLPSVVNVSSTRVVGGNRGAMRHPMFRDFFRFHRPSPRQQRGLGSGVILSADGVVVTNNHVIAKADKITVTLWDKREYKAKVIGADPKSDVALLRLQGAKNLRPIAFGDSDRMRLGDVVLAIGNPFGVGQTVTMGIVSAKGRANMGIVAYEDFIQTDAAINPGNSGGALINMRGELVGINTAILSRSGGYQGIGFAIPSNMVKPIKGALLKGGKVRRGWLGVVIQEVTPALKRAMKLPTRQGVLISDIDPRGPAAKAGVQRGDLVVKIDGRTVSSVGRLRNIVAAAGDRAKVKLELYRNGKKRWIDARLAELPADLGGTARVAPARQGGLSVEPLSPKNRNRFNISPRLRSGVVIASVRPGSKADRAGLQQGDVILEVNRVRIVSVSRFTQLFTAARGQLLMLVYRRGVSQYLLIQK